MSIKSFYLSSSSVVPSAMLPTKSFWVFRLLCPLLSLSSTSNWQFSPIQCNCKVCPHLHFPPMEIMFSIQVPNRFLRCRLRVHVDKPASQIECHRKVPILAYKIIPESDTSTERGVWYWPIILYHFTLSHSSECLEQRTDFVIAHLHRRFVKTCKFSQFYHINIV